jgi:hypothetical protein
MNLVWLIKMINLKYEAHMKLQRTLILILGLLLCILWLDFITPRLHSGPHDYLVLSPSIFVLWVIGWIVIAGFIAVLIKLLKKK